MGSLVHMKEATVITPSDQTSSSVMSLSALDSQLFLCFTIEYLLVYPPVSDLRTGGALAQSRRGFLVELGTREKALLAEDAASWRFMSHKKGCCYEIYARAVMREDEAQDVEGSSSVSLSPSLTI